MVVDVAIGVIDCAAKSVGGVENRLGNGRCRLFGKHASNQVRMDNLTDEKEDVLNSQTFPLVQLCGARLIAAPRRLERRCGWGCQSYWRTGWARFSILIHLKDTLRIKAGWS